MTSFRSAAVGLNRSRVIRTGKHVPLTGLGICEDYEDQQEQHDYIDSIVESDESSEWSENEICDSEAAFHNEMFANNVDNEENEDEDEFFDEILKYVNENGEPRKA